ncbi:MAG TPA: cytochrome c biogenesis protein CcsA [Terriglobales bacterium]|jgi:heme exporter protein C|nr:cytochrome c biogenesis protein CcsA [Terriglobales bacterium]
MKNVFALAAVVVLLLLSYGLYQGLVAAPTEATMGDVQRIFYYHLPSAFLAFLCFIVNFFASATYLMTRSERADALAVSAAEVGVVFCTVVLVTGPLWARPVWGIWWTWDARLTSTLLLWLVYLSYMVLRHFAHGGVAALLSSALAIFGFVDVGFVYMANRWFRTQHPAPVLAGGSDSGLDPRMGYALLINFLAFLAYGSMLVWIRYRMERSYQRLEQAHALAALQGGNR